jgi:hypothetical protein
LSAKAIAKPAREAAGSAAKVENALQIGAPEGFRDHIKPLPKRCWRKGAC